jgi:hypothetical protein
MSMQFEISRQMAGKEHGRPPRDLIDFYRRWSEFRQTAMDLAKRPDLSQAERETMRWLVLLVDRIAERDVND